MIYFVFVLVKTIREYYNTLFSKVEVSLESTEYQINQDHSSQFQLAIFNSMMANQWGLYLR